MRHVTWSTSQRQSRTTSSSSKLILLKKMVDQNQERQLQSVEDAIYAYIHREIGYKEMRKRQRSDTN